jgi:hypothetical protein
MSFAVSIAEEDDDDAASSGLSDSLARAQFFPPAALSIPHDSPDSRATAEAQVHPIHPLAGGESCIPMPGLDLDTLSNADHTQRATHPMAAANARSTGAMSGHTVNASMSGGGGDQAAPPPPPPPPSMFSLIGILNNYRMRVRCHTLDNLFGKINLDARTWNLLVRSQLPRNDLAMGLEQLLDTVTEFVKR